MVALKEKKKKCYILFKIALTYHHCDNNNISHPIHGHEKQKENEGRWCPLLQIH